MGSENSSTAPRVGMCGGRRTSRAGSESAIAFVCFLVKCFGL